MTDAIVATGSTETHSLHPQQGCDHEYGLVSQLAPSDQQDTSISGRKALFVIGLIMIAIEASAWVLSGYIPKLLKEWYAYDEPILILAVNKSSCILFLPIWWIATSTSIARHAATRTSVTAKTNMETCDSQRFSFADFVWCAAWLGPLTVAYSLTWLYSLGLTTMGVNSSLYMSFIAFVYLFSVLLMGDKLTASKVSSVVLCLAGVCIVSFLGSASTKGDDHPTTELGVFLTLLSAVLFALYQVLFSKFGVDHHSPSQVWDCCLFLGLFGFTTTLVDAGILLFLHQGYDQDFPLPTDTGAWWLLSMVFVCSLTFNLSYILAIIFTNPLLVSVGSVLTIPLSAIIDVVFMGKPFSVIDGSGAAVIAAGFLLLTFLHHREIQQHSTQADQPVADQIHSLADEEREQLLRPT